jgi:Cellulase (glycosyl hydrolase family 5)
MHINRARSGLRVAAALGLAVLVAVLAAAMVPGRAAGDQTQVSILEDDPLMLSSPQSTLLRVRQLGAGAVRMMMAWDSIAPSTDSFRRPAHFDPADPADYPATSWRPYDAAIEDAQADGITVDLDVIGGAPLWATGPQMPHTKNCPCHNWDPSAAQFDQFMTAVATRYSGNYDPTLGALEPGDPNDLPRVDFWSIWNEPDYGPSLAPQAVPGYHDVEDAPQIYRALSDAAWAALRATGHRSDTIVIGELAPRGTLRYGNFDGMTPLVFLRALYCVGASYRPLRGVAARLRDCPTTAAGSARFAARNPVLFHASGFSDHPYMRWYPPNREERRAQPRHFRQLLPDYTTLATIGQLETALRRATRAYRHARGFPIWNTEFGYQTNPPKHPNRKDPNPWVSQRTAAYYDNWAEYISWKNPWIRSFDQYLLEDPLPDLGLANDFGGYASGLLDYGGRQKPGYGAFRLPLFLPRTRARSGQQLEVWGAVKPAFFTRLDLPYQEQTVDILFEPAGSTSFSVIASVPILSAEGYFDTELEFPSSGTVALEWTYPDDPLLAASGYPVFSRHVKVTVS